MDIQEFLNSQKKVWAEQSRDKGAMCADDIIIALKSIKDKDKTVIIIMNDERYISDFAGDSWRGSYDLPAISYEEYNEDEDNGYSVKTVIENLKEIDGMEVTGYKGGDFTLSKFDPLFVANYGSSNDCTAIVDIFEIDEFVICRTKQDMY